MNEVYKACPVKRSRRSKVELEALRSVIYDVCQLDHPLSVRGVFYRVMSTGAIEKTEREYDAVQRQVLEMRRAGSLPYEWIADGTRWSIKGESWGSVEQALDDVAASYRRALWHDQNVYVEVWSEKDAISSIISPITSKWDIHLQIARGFSSESFLWSTAKTISAVNKPTVVYQLGDHDPSGWSAWQHIQKRLAHFAPDAEIYFERLAVTEPQITTLGLPTRPTKKTDSRSKTFKGESVEVDAIETSVLRSIVEEAITSHIDPVVYEATMIAERSERAGLEVMAAGWNS